jgi:putative hemolysin
MRPVYLLSWLCLGGCATSSIVEDERQNAGNGNPATLYCLSQGYVSRLSDDSCLFPDQTTCKQFAFYRGECGAAFSFCIKRGGQVRAVTSTVGTSTVVNSYCTLNGVQCKEQEFVALGVCK